PLRLHPHREMATALDLHRRRVSPILPVVPVCQLIACPPKPWRRRIDLVICSLLFLVKVRVDWIAAARCLAMELGSRLALIADFFAARFSRAVDSIGPESSYPCRICFEFVTADSVA